MNDFILFLAIFIGVSLLSSYMNKRSDEKQGSALQPNGVPKCPPHKWTYKKIHPDDEQESMICDKCKRIPLQD